MSERASVEVGQVLKGKYRVERILATGGMGFVVAATHLELEQRFALKILLPEIHGIPAAADRFLREARAAARLRSVHVARVVDIGKLDDGTPFMVMELLEGKDLQDVVDHDGARPIAEAVDYVLQACEALAEAHALGIVHRDLKPANMFLTVASCGAVLVKLLDFGISKLPDSVRGITPRITLGVGGTPLYMAPEQMESPHDVDERADIWSLGVSLYELLTAELPFEADTVVGLHKLMMAGTFLPPSFLDERIPRALDGVILRCLRPRPEERFTDVVSLAEALSEFGPDGTGAQVGRIVRIASGMFRQQRLAQLLARHGSASGRGATELQAPPADADAPATVARR
jgi:serine/threonine-protein kinase